MQEVVTDTIIADPHSDAYDSIIMQNLFRDPEKKQKHHNILTVHKCHIRCNYPWHHFYNNHHIRRINVIHIDLC